MKTLLATTAAIVLASSSAFAYDSSIDAEEFYNGQSDSKLITNAQGLDSNLHLEGKFVDVSTEVTSPEGAEIGSALDDADIYQEGKFDV